METNNENLSVINQCTTDINIDNQFLTFQLENEEYGIEIAYIKEIVVMCPITKIPHTPNYLKGIINLRGEIIPVIDVRERFLKPFNDYDNLTCIIVVEYKEFNMGLIVDRVKEVTFINEENLMPPPNDNFNYYNQFIKNIGKSGEKVKLILDLDKLLTQQ